MEELRIENGCLRVVRIPEFVMLEAVEDPLKVPEIGGTDDPWKIPKRQEIDIFVEKKAS
jgi:hypothetical protein